MDDLTPDEIEEAIRCMADLEHWENELAGNEFMPQYPGMDSELEHEQAHYTKWEKFKRGFKRFLRNSTYPHIYGGYGI